MAPALAPSDAPAPVRRVLLLTAGAVTGLDALSKVVAVAVLDGRSPVGLPLGLGRLRIYRNPGGPRGFLEDHTVVVTTASAAVLTAVWMASRQATSRTEAVGFGLLLGGGVGNLLDRVTRSPGPLRGHVVDWLQPSWSHAVMNLADLALQGGLVVLVVGAATAWVRAHRPCRRLAGGSCRR